MLQSMGQRLSGSRVRRRTSQQGDAGFTLTEVIWALFLLSLVAMAALGLFLNGMTSVSDMQRQQAAASLAATALDKARAVTGTDVNNNGTSGLIKGRSQAAVSTSWDELTAFDAALTADMTMGGTGHPAEAWDVAPGMTQSDQWVPIREVQTVANQEYTVDTLVGLCYRLKTSPNMDQACTQSRTSVDDAVMYRVRVLVRWDTGTGEQQTYTASTLVDPTEDAVWNTALLPYAYDDEFVVVAGAPTSFHAIVANDTVELGSANPMVNYTQPSHGSYTLGTGVANEGINFTPPSDDSGTVTFTYQLRDGAGHQTLEPATVMVHIVPSPADDELAVGVDSVTELNDLLLDNDIGVRNISADRETTIRPYVDGTVDYFSTEAVPQEILNARNDDIAALAALGVTVGSDGVVRFQAPAEIHETVTFSYYLVDSPKDGEGPHYPNTENRGTVTITTAEIAPEAADESFRLDATAPGTPLEDQFTKLDWRALGTYDDDARIRIPSTTPGSEPYLRLDGTTGNESTLVDVLEFRATNNNVGVHEIEYIVVTALGTESEPATLTVTVAPKAESFRTDVERREDLYLDLVRIGTPNTQVEVVDLSSAICGRVEVVNRGSFAGQVLFEAPDVNRNEGSKTCTFTYRLGSTSFPGVKSHETATVTIDVWRSR